MKLKWLRVHPEVVKEYEKLKKGVAARFDNNIDQYCDEKDAYVRYIESVAVRWLMSGSYFKV